METRSSRSAEIQDYLILLVRELGWQVFLIGVSLGIARQAPNLWVAEND